MKNRFLFKQFVPENFWKKTLAMFFGIFFMGFFLSILIKVNWGTDPATFMNLNIAHLLGWTLGNWQLLLNAFMLVLVIVFKPQLIGFGTIFNMISLGYITDFFCWVWEKNGVADFIQNGTFGIKIAVFSCAIILFVFSVATYINAEMGLSPYDGTAKIFTGTLKWLPFFVARMIFDFAAVGIGFAAARLSGKIQGSVLGAFIMAILLGPAITLVEKPAKKILGATSHSKPKFRSA